ncbi:MAG: hypothetical protein E7040_04580 [Lentisphaerae bacterium]|nr:hypothetical protein [Lentisphaerota bacterium]
MKKLLLIALALVAAFACFAQGAKKKPKVEFKVTLIGEKTVFKPGDVIQFKMEFKAPENYRHAAWVALAYVKNVPADFAKAIKKEVKGKAPYQNVHFMKYQWLPNDGKKEYIGKFSTANFPEGDYNISVTGLFREKPKANIKTDVYQGADLIFSIEK